jgi:hypothetical protein
LDSGPAEALPQQALTASYKLQANDETRLLQHFSAAHTDTDIYVRFQKAKRNSDGSFVIMRQPRGVSSIAVLIAICSPCLSGSNELTPFHPCLVHFFSAEMKPQT